MSGFLRLFLGLTFIYDGLQKLTDSGFLVGEVVVTWNQRLSSGTRRPRHRSCGFFVAAETLSEGTSLSQPDSPNRVDGMLALFE